MKEISLEEFQDSGLLWLINQTLHLFGMAITIEYKNKKPIRMYPAKVKFRGFDGCTNNRGYKKVTNYMIENSKELIKDCDKGEIR